MKTMLLAGFVAAAVSSAIAASNDAAAPSTPAPAAKPPAVSTSSHVTVTIDSGGKRETHEIDLGSAPTLKVHGKDTVTIATAPGDKASGANAGTPPSEPQNLTLTPGTLNLSTGTLTFLNKPGPSPWLGVTIEPVSEELLAQLPIEKGAGLILKSVVPDGPAARAGLQKNDVLVKLDDQLLVNGNQLSALVQMKKDGDKVGLTYFRGGKSSATEAQIQMHQEDHTDSIYLAGGTLTVNSGPVGDSPATTVDKDGHIVSTNIVSTNLGEMVVVDKDGHVLVTKTQPDLTAVTAQVEKILRAAGVDDKTITQTELTIAEAAKAAGNAASSIGNANSEVARQIKDATDQVAKSLEKARAETERARQQAEEARERLEKQANPKKTTEGQ